MEVFSTLEVWPKQSQIVVHCNCYTEYNWHPTYNISAKKTITPRLNLKTNELQSATNPYINTYHKHITEEKTDLN